MKGTERCLTALGRGTVQLQIKQDNQEPLIPVTDIIIYAPDFPIRLISPQQIHCQYKSKGREKSCFTTYETTASLFHGGGLHL
jgi:hypothetical protein